MPAKASWGPKSFLTTPKKIVPFSSFSTSVKLKSDSENDTSGTEPTNTRGRELQSMDFETTCLLVAGLEPMTEFYSWCDLLGKNYPLYVGGTRVGPAERFTLKGIDASDLMQAEDGTVLSLTIGLSFIEFSEGKTSKLANTSAAGTTDETGGNETASKARATYEATVAAKTEAKNARAALVERAERKGMTAS